MKTLGELFKRYLEDTSLLPSVEQAAVQSMNIDTQKRTMELDVAFSQPVERRVLFDTEKSLAKSRLNLNFVNIYPKFPKDSFSVDYYPELIQELSRKIASLNGTVKDSTARLEGDRLTVSLKHGGKERLASKKFDKELSRLIYQEFGVSVQVEFDGVLQVEHQSEVYIQKQQIREEKAKREAVVREIEEYEAHDYEGKKKENPCISIRRGETLSPTVLLSTAKPLYGKPGKGKPIAIQAVAPDSGSVTIWGEVFSLEKKETRDKKRNIYSIQITDYTSSMTLKIIEMKEQCKMLDTIAKGMALLVRGEVNYDKYDREIVLRPRSICSVENVKWWTMRRKNGWSFIYIPICPLWTASTPRRISSTGPMSGDTRLSRLQTMAWRRHFPTR